MTSQVRVRQLGDDYARFSIQNEFFHGTMDPNPAKVNGIRQRLLELVRDQHARMPACATVEHVEDDVLVDEQERSHSTCLLKVSGISTLHTLFGPGAAHMRHTLQVSQISGIKSRIASGTPTRSRKRRITAAEACHHRTCSFLSVRRWAPTPPVLKSRTTRPISKLVQSDGFSGF